MWNYVYFFLHIHSMSPNDHNAMEKYVYDNVRHLFCYDAYSSHNFRLKMKIIKKLHFFHYMRQKFYQITSYKKNFITDSVHIIMVNMATNCLFSFLINITL